MGDDFEDIYAQSAATQAEPDFLQGDDGAANAEKPGGEDLFGAIVDDSKRPGASETASGGAGGGGGAGDDDDDDDDDGVDISFADAPAGNNMAAAAAAAAAAIAAKPAGGQISINLGAGGAGGAQRAGSGQASASGAAGGSSGGQGSVYDFDIEGVEDKPWSKPGVHATPRSALAFSYSLTPRRAGADMSDWFNYGFNEEAWKAYCQKQKTLREEYQLQSKIKVPAPLPDTALTAAPLSPKPRRRCTRPVTARDPTAAEIAALRLVGLGRGHRPAGALHRPGGEVRRALAGEVRQGLAGRGVVRAPLCGWERRQAFRWLIWCRCVHRRSRLRSISAPVWRASGRTRTGTGRASRRGRRRLAAVVRERPRAALGPRQVRGCTLSFSTRRMQACWSKLCVRAQAVEAQGG